MNWKQHLRIGVLSSGSFALLMAIVFGWFEFKFLTLLELGAVIIFSGLVPDLDHENGKLHQWLIGLGLLMALVGFGLFYFNEDYTLVVYGVIIAAVIFFIGEFSNHRGRWHSIPACIAYGVVIGIVTSYEIGLVAFVGCYSHLVADSVPFKIK